jgi:hypothetical protein
MRHEHSILQFPAVELSRNNQPLLVLDNSKHRLKGKEMKRTVFALLVGFTLAACTTANEEMQEAGIEPLAAGDIRTELIDTTQYGVSREGNNYAVYRAPDGEMRGKAWGSWGESFDTGAWSVNDDGVYCAKWNEWRNAREGCWNIYETDDGFTFAAVSGRAQDVEIDNDQLKEGNPDGL